MHHSSAYGHRGRQELISLTPTQTRAVTGGGSIPILIRDENGQISIERIYHPTLPTFPIKILGSSPY